MFLHPDASIAQLGLREGMRVADFGAGSGHYAKSLGMRVGHTGRVYAVEIQKDLVHKLEQEIKEWHATNITVIWGNAEKKNGTKLADRSMDAVLLSNVLFQADDKLGMIDEAKRILRHGGKVLVIDWAESFGNMGPHPEYVVTEKKAEELFAKRGFKFVETIAAGAHHYGIIFTHE